MLTLQKMFLLVFAALMLSSCTTTYYLVRHAEKEGGNDPVLTQAGTTRANTLRDTLQNKGIDKVFVTNYQRTQLTGAPTATAIGVPATEIPANNTPQLITQLRQQSGKQILVVGHSNTIPVIIDSLMKSPQNIHIDEDDFDNLFKVKIKGGDPIQRILTRTTYGETSP